MKQSKLFLNVFILLILTLVFSFTLPEPTIDRDDVNESNAVVRIVGEQTLQQIRRSLLILVL